MIETKFTARTCLSCNYYHYCKVYWGKECKMQGGTKIPRINYESGGMGKKAKNSLTQRAAAPREINLKIEPIRTRKPLW